MTGKRILAAVDGSAYSDRVLDKAIEFARVFGGEVLLVYCHKKYPKLLGQPYLDQAISAIMNKTEKVFEPYLAKLRDSGVPFAELAVEEPAGTMLVTVADNEKCEMIIMGSRGKSDLEGLIIGSVTHKVLHLAKCPVLVVK
ncbi:universal stress protein [Desulfopila aestuarii]|uniref:Nucleotide-binding universal stress protein, UspA family n=1 Tax=Desulfopila aestuarii DSM 18488 TaxID=1121416 RepID=A0A1M7Y581_9BACT|nr:universal stress protein [Desulfopila aestuarii]SHO47611.1 Nucleotide-binding universal stress protein, UspA family [Desulfopila aestuarii DSM 18488]